MMAVKTKKMEMMSHLPTPIDIITPISGVIVLMI